MKTPEKHLRQTAYTRKNTKVWWKAVVVVNMEKGWVSAQSAPSQKSHATKTFCEPDSDVKHSCYICNCWNSCKVHTFDENDYRRAISQADQLGHLGGNLTGDKPSRCIQSGDSPTILHSWQTWYNCQRKAAMQRDGMRAGVWAEVTWDKCSEYNKFGQSFRQKSHFLGHQRTHTGDRLYPCNGHGISVSKDYLLIVHRRIHVERILINVIIVGKPSVPAVVFIEHKRAYTGEKPHECNQCGKSFNHHSSLVLYHRIHSGENH